MEEKTYDTTRSAVAVEAMGYRRISWGAIIAGTVAALAVQLLLTLLGMAIGLWTLPAAGPEFMEEIGIGAAIWAVLTFVIALYFGGWIAGRMSGLGSKFDGFLEGFMVWGLMTVVTFMLLTTTVGSVIGGAAGLTGEVISQASQQLEDPQEAMQEFGAPAREAREALEDADVAEKAEDVATGGAAASLGAFISLFLGALAASLAGRQGSVSGLKEAHATAAPGGRDRPGHHPGSSKADVVQ